MTLRIEFCGVPASGKTSLSRGTVNLLRHRGHDVLDREEVVAAGLRKRDFGLIGDFIGTCMPAWRRDFLGVPHSLNDWHHFVVNNSAFVALIHDWLAHTNTDADWRSCVFYAFLTTAFEFHMSLEAGTPAVLDEGFSQRFFTLRGYCGFGRNGDAACYAGAMPLPTILISIDTSPEICLSRLKKRKHLPLLLQNEPEELLLKRIGEGARLLTELTTELERRGVKVMRVVGERDPQPIVESISDFIEKYIPTR